MKGRRRPVKQIRLDAVIDVVALDLRSMLRSWRIGQLTAGGIAFRRAAAAVAGDDLLLSDGSAQGTGAEGATTKASAFFLST